MVTSTNAPGMTSGGTTDAATLNDLIEVLNDGAAFYDEAASHVERPDLKQLFGRMSSHKRQIGQDLAAAVRAQQKEPATGGTFAGSMRKLYAELRTSMSSDKNHEYVAQLEEFEDRILHAFRDAANEADDDGVRQIADRHMKAVQDDHDVMRNLKKAG